MDIVYAVLAREIDYLGTCFASFGRESGYRSRRDAHRGRVGRVGAVSFQLESLREFVVPGAFDSDDCRVASYGCGVVGEDYLLRRFGCRLNRRTELLGIFARDADTGMLTDTGKRIKTEKPVCLVFVAKK